MANETIYWPNVAVKTAIGAAILWPVIRVIGGVSGVRGILTAVAASSAVTAGQLVYERTNLPTLPLTGSLNVLPDSRAVYDLRPNHNTADE